MACRSTFLRMGDDEIDNAETVLDFVAHQLEQRSKDAESVLGELGSGVAQTVRPWVMLCTHSQDAFENVLRRKARELCRSGHGAEQRRWLEDIRLCSIETIHQLRALLCAIHIHPVAAVGEKRTSADLLTWIASEKDGQPPCLIVVHNLLDMLLTSATPTLEDRGLPDNDTVDRRFMRVRYDHLTHTLALLIETCDYLSSQARGRWEQAFQGLKTGWATDLLVTDNGCVPNQPSDSEPALVQLYRILEYYLDHVL